MAIGSVDDAQFQAFANKVKNKIESQQLKHELEKTSKKVGEQGLRLLKSNTPVDSGNLRRNWTAEGPNISGAGWTIELINNAEYASYVEQGHRQTPGRFVPAIGKSLKAAWVPGQFFMKKSVNQLQRQIPSMLEPDVVSVLKDLFDD